MGTPYLAEVKIVSFNFAPKGWAMCNGQLLPINQNQALFSLLGTTYGGDGRVNFALPDLRGRVPIHRGNGHTWGERAGQEFHTVTSSELPAHTHVPNAVQAAPNTGLMTGNYWATGAYGVSPGTTLNPASVTNVGGSQPHENRQPYLVLNMCIALQGVYPSQN